MKKSNDTLKRFGKRVRELRQARGITSQMDFALKAGLDRTYIGGIERGERNVALINIIKISKALGVGPDELLKSF